MTDDNSGWALALGPGGPVGTAWLLGLAAGLRAAGLDPAGAGLIVGTSAGAIAGAAIAAGRDLAALEELPPREDPPPVDGSVMARVFEVARAPGLEPDEIRRAIGRLALDAAALPTERHHASMRYLVGTDTWPDTRLLITGVDAESGEPALWDSSSGVPLSLAVAASSAAPGFAEPVTIGGRRYMDGAFAGWSAAELAQEAGPLVALEPMPHMRGGETVRILPDARALDAFGENLGDRSRWTPVYREGLRQAPEAAERIAAALAAGR
ncbi:patatin-like phospholipase family protein [Actinomadura luteofluorescens]|uniref:patatin-like phospholipase family protein n=1 Tax=Actinomadura luteofluorescens TaxID=46163 RepID=UPI002164455B|nr:patatin-like phospholipase family protein [Actinomadura glauciflava]MCR3740585.1 NTE family protein [Actinomadura glauciflava]